jgi:hypothetical protein
VEELETQILKQHAQQAEAGQGAAS